MPHAVCTFLRYLKSLGWQLWSSYLCVVERLKKIILFDGFCNLCNNFVQFVIKEDKDDVFYFASLQSKIGQQLTSERNIDVDSIDSVVLIEPNVVYYLKSDAVLEIGKSLKRYRAISLILQWLPKGLRDIVYDFTAGRRYKWFGKKETCMVPSEALKAKFLDSN